MLTGALRSEDTEVMVDCLSKLGFASKPDADRAQRSSVHNHELTADRSRRSPPICSSPTPARLVRFLTAMVAWRRAGIDSMVCRECASGRFRTCSTHCNQLGVDADSEHGNGCPPVIIERAGLRGGTSQQFEADVSSQFLSGLLLSAPIRRRGIPRSDRSRGQLVSEPYVEMTLAMLAAVESTIRAFRDDT